MHVREHTCVIHVYVYRCAHVYLYIYVCASVFYILTIGNCKYDLMMLFVCEEVWSEAKGLLYGIGWPEAHALSRLITHASGSSNFCSVVL